MSSRPEPHRDHRTIGSFKRTANAALLIWVTNRTREPGPQQAVRPARLVLAAVTVVVLALGADLTTLPSIGSAIGL